MISYGIVGLPNVGKSTLFNALSRGAHAEVSNYPFCTVDRNVGVISVPDERLDKLANVFQQEKVVPAAIELFDIAGLIEGASKGEGLGNKFLAHIRETDALLHVVRCFADPQVTRVSSRGRRSVPSSEINPIIDIGIVNYELYLADLQTVEKRIESTKRAAKSGDKELLRQYRWLKSLKLHLEEGKPARNFFNKLEDVHFEEMKNLINQLFLLSAKPVMYIANIGEDLTESELMASNSVRKYAEEHSAEFAEITAKLEAELTELDEDEAELFREELSISETGLELIIRKSYDMMNLITFFTGVGKELRAWTLTSGTTASEAAGKIHSDMQKGFIKAEVIPAEELISVGSWAKAKDAGKITVFGRDYEIQDEDVVFFHFKVT